jgi:tRNA A-37 threonylcarbamoyl transferase component Bud32
MPKIVPTNTLDFLLQQKCRVDTTIHQDPQQQQQHLQQLLFDTFELNRNALAQAMNQPKSNKNLRKPETLEDALKLGLSESAKETHLQQLCFDDLKLIGNYTLENTSGAIFGGDDDANYRKSNFASNHEKSSQPDLTLRLQFPSDVNLKDYKKATEPPNLETHRLFPWSIMAYVELKKWSENLNNHLPQALYYCHQTLACCPNRKFFFTAVYNFKSLVFSLAVIVDGEWKYYSTDCVFDAEASRDLARFLTFPPQTLGFGNEFPLTHCTPTAPLGRGSTSVCLEVLYAGLKYVAKISRDRHALHIERLILRYLKNPGSSIAVPSVVTPEDNPELFAGFISSDTSSGLPYISFLTDVYQTRFESKITTKNIMEEVWSILRKAHSLGICHRDVRFPNLCFKNIDGKLTVFLIDWSSAKPFIPISELASIANDSYIQGSCSTASNKVLQKMIANINNYECFPSDEAISLIYLAHKLHTGNKRLSQLPIRTAKEFWEREISGMGIDVREAINALEAMDTADAIDEHQAIKAFRGFGEADFDSEKINNYLNIVEGHVKTALHGIFRVSDGNEEKG